VTLAFFGEHLIYGSSNNQLLYITVLKNSGFCLSPSLSKASFDDYIKATLFAWSSPCCFPAARDGRFDDPQISLDFAGGRTPRK